MNRPRANKNFSLLELIIGMVLFAIFAVTSSGVVSYISKSWNQKRSQYDIVHNARWAVERMTSELRQSHIAALIKIVGAGNFTTCNGDATDVCDGIVAVSYGANTDTSMAIYYWREGAKLYRGSGTTFSAAINNRQQLADYLYYNAANTSDPKNALFYTDTLERIYNYEQVYNIDITVRDPNVIKDGNPLEYRVKGRVRPQK